METEAVKRVLEMHAEKIEAYKRNIAEADASGGIDELAMQKANIEFGFCLGLRHGLARFGHYDAYAKCVHDLNEAMGVRDVAA